MKIFHTVGQKSAEIDIVETETKPMLVALDRTKFMKDEHIEFFALRSPIAQKLVRAQDYLPKGYQFMILETYRSTDKQVKLWQAECAKIKAQYPDISEKNLVEKANMTIANPFRQGSGHQTGAAVDLTLCYEGKVLDMGSSYLDGANPKTVTDAGGLTPQQAFNRKLLQKAMTAVGFVNYPFEWWHYSYGELEWAVITNQKKTLYAPLKDAQIRYHS